MGFLPNFLALTKIFIGFCDFMTRKGLKTPAEVATYVLIEPYPAHLDYETIAESL